MYLLKSFDNVNLSQYNINMTEAPVPARTAFIETTAGVFDSDGEGRSRQSFPHGVRYSAVYMESSLAASRMLLDSLRAKVGIRGKLVRIARDDETEEHFCIARLVAAPYETSAGDKNWRELSLDFQQLGQWQGDLHGSGWRFDAGVEFDDDRDFDEVPPTPIVGNDLFTQTQITYTHAGNIPTTNIVVTIFGGSATISAVNVSGPGWEWLWQDNTFGLAAGNTLVVDGGAHSVLNNDADAYQYFSQINTTIDDWMQVNPGVNDLFVSIQGGGTGSKVSIVFYEAWA